MGVGGADCEGRNEWKGMGKGSTERVEGDGEPLFERSAAWMEKEVEDRLGGVEDGAGVEEEKGRDEGPYGFGN